MLRSLSWRLGLVALLMFVSPARPADPAAPPSLVIKLASLDRVLGDLGYLGELTGRKEMAQQLEGFLKEKGGEKGLQGVDTKRPMAIYGQFGATALESTAVAVLPIADEKSFLGLLETLDVKAEKGADDIYTVTSEKLPLEIYFRFASKHVYATVRSKGPLAREKLIAPERVFAGAGGDALASLSLRLDQLPDNQRTILLDLVRGQANEARKTEVKDETPSQAALRKATIDTVESCLTSLARDGSQVALSFNIDRKGGEITAEASLQGKAGSELAKELAALGQSKSRVAGLVSPESAMNLVAHATLPDAVRQVLGPGLEEQVRKALTNEQDEKKRAQAEKLFRAILPTLKAGRLDAALDLRGPSSNGRYTIVFGQAIEDAAALDKGLRDLVAGLPAEERAHFALDAEKEGATSLHRVTLQGTDEQFKRLFGGEHAYVAVRTDAVIAALGEGALEALKKALATSATTAPTLKLDVSLARLAPLMAREQPAAPKAAATAFTEKGSDVARVTFQGGQALSLRAVMKAPVLRFFHLLEEATPKEK